MMRNFLLPLLAAAIILGIVVFAGMHSSAMPILSPQGPVALHERWVILVTVGLCAIVVVPVFFILFIFAWRYRSGNPHAKVVHEPNWDHDSSLAELVWWFVPSVIVIILAVIAWQTAHELDPFKPLSGEPAPLTIQAIALDWKWLFIYPAQGIATVNMVEFPANTPIRFELTADAPMNQFWIPSLAGQVMAMPGMTTELNLLASKTGTFPGRSSNISGDGFSGMVFDAHAVSKSDFDAWVQSVQAQTHPLDATQYAALAAPSEHTPVTTYFPVDAQLYTASVMKYMMPNMQ